jgi:phosphoenolpyruvate carboxylase
MNGFRFEHYVKHARTQANANPYLRMIDDLKKRLDQAHSEFLTVLSTARPRYRLLALLANPEEISRRIMRIAQVQVDYNNDLITIRRFTQLLHTIRRRGNRLPGDSHGKP